MITPQDRFDAALRRLHEALTEQINKLDHDIATAAARKPVRPSLSSARRRPASASCSAVLS